jgi:hypothetical protein
MTCGPFQFVSEQRFVRLCLPTLTDNSRNVLVDGPLVLTGEGQLHFRDLAQNRWTGMFKAGNRLKKKDQLAFSNKVSEVTRKLFFTVSEHLSTCLL